MLSLSQKSMGAFAHLPNELWLNIAFFVVATSPLGPPPLRSLLLINKRISAVLNTDALKARIFRLSWDSGAVLRRSFQPHNRELAEQLVLCCTLLKAIKERDLTSVEVQTHLFTAYILMLDNDGKNYAQLEWAGIDAYVDGYIRQSLFSDRDTNMGWPIDSSENACALWLAWMTIKRGNFSLSFSLLIE